MPDEDPTFSTVGEQNIREREKRKGYGISYASLYMAHLAEAEIREREKRALAEWEEHQRFLANEYERL